MAESWTHSADYKNWTIKVRSGVEFQDGANVSAVDAVFTLQAYMTPALNSPLYPLFADVFGSNSSVFQGANSSMVEIRLPKPYAYVMDLLSVPILPEHILGQIRYDEWRTSPLNTGIPSSVQLLNGTTVVLTGPVGAGPYSYVDYNSTSGTYHLQKFNNYFNGTMLEAAGLFQVQHYYVNESIRDGLDAIVQLHIGDVQVLDMQYHLELLGSYLRQFVPKTVGRVANFSSLSVQEVGFNMRHSILGTGIDTPAGRADSSSAADAAKHVRKAIAYAIPREEIVANLLAGYGLPGRTSVFCPLSEGYDQAIPFYDNLTAAAAELRLAGYEPASIIPGFLDTYGTVILIIAVSAISLITLFTLQKTKHIFKMRRPGIGQS
jgi:ABC-type transport system substrate-binding protein